MTSSGLSNRVRFENVVWAKVPAVHVVYVIYEIDKVVYVGMAGETAKVVSAIGSETTQAARS